MHNDVMHKSLPNIGRTRPTGVRTEPPAGVGGGTMQAEQPSFNQLQRTFGNRAIEKASDGKSAESATTGDSAAGADARKPTLSSRVFAQIVERGLHGAVGNTARANEGRGTGQKNGGVQRKASGSDTVIQRWVPSGQFEQWSTNTFVPNKPDVVFDQIRDQLRFVENFVITPADQNSPPEVLKQRTDDIKAQVVAIRKIYKTCDEWMLTPESLNSPGLNLIKYLMEDLRNVLSPPQQQQQQTSSTTNKAGTSLGKSNVTVDRQATLTPEQTEAFEVINNTNLHKLRKEHAQDMIRNPDMIEQGAFGVCGLTSILHAVATANPRRFAEMIRDAWADSEVVTKWLEVFYNNADPRHIDLRAEVEYITAQWVVRKSQKEKGNSLKLDQEILDHNTRRESETDKERQYKDVFDRQKKFSDSFEIDGWENTLGHFALTAGAISQLLNGLGTGKPSYKIKRRNMEQDLAMAERLKGSNSSVLASVTNIDFYQSGKDVTTDFLRSDQTKGGSKPPKDTTSGGSTTGGTTTGQTNTGQTNTGQTNTGQTNTGQTNTGQTNTGQTNTGQTNTGQTNTGQTNTVTTTPTPSKAPKYVHWVVLKGAKLGTDGFYDLDIWTWRANYKARVHKDVIYSHIYSLMVVNSKVW